MKPLSCFCGILAALRRIRFIPPPDRDKYAYWHASQLFACRLITLRSERSEGRSAMDAASRHDVIASSGKRRTRQIAHVCQRELRVNPCPRLTPFRFASIANAVSRQKRSSSARKQVCKDFHCDILDHLCEESDRERLQSVLKAVISVHNNSFFSPRF